ncbi:MAG: hypothetical protein ACE5KT_04275, partial [Methanosarcinales archaeon]
MQPTNKTEAINLGNGIIDFKKIEELEKNPKKVEEIVWYWANKAVKDQNLSWDDAMNSACKE